MIAKRFIFGGLMLVTALATPAVAQQPKDRKLPEGVEVFRDVSYGSHQRNKLDIFIPKSDKPLPLIVWVHGGGWEAGSKENNPALQYLTRGYAVAGINYRYSSQAVFPAQIEDCKAAIRFLRDNVTKYKFDPKMIGVWGASAGGHLVALLGTTGDVKDWDGSAKTSSAVQAVVNWFGPTDMAKMSPPGIDGNPITRLFGGDTGKKADLVKQGNPITHISKGDAPMLIFHGDSDKLVPLQQSELLDEGMKKASLECELVVFKKAGHGDKEFQSQMGQDVNRKKLSDFFEKHLKAK